MRLFKAIVLYSIIPLFANFLTVIFQSFANSSLFNSSSNFIAMNEFQKGGIVVIAQSLPFAIITIFIILYMIPIFKVYLAGIKDEKISTDVGQRVFNAPFFLSLLGSGGWLVAVFVSIAAYKLSGLKFSLSMFVSLTLINLLYGTLSFVLTYFPLDFLSRKWIIPDLFPGGNLYRFKRSLDRTILGRFLIYLYAVGIFPSISFLLLLVAKSKGSDETVLFVIFFAIISSLNFFLTYLISQSFLKPVIEMKFATTGILEANYDVRVPVVSTDEMGSLAESVNKMADGLKEKEFIKSTFGRMVDPAVMEHLLSGEIELGGELKEATVLFTDIRDFTTFSESMPADQIVLILNRYFERMATAVREENGFINKFIGDAVMAVFGLPIRREDHVILAIRCAMRMVAYRNELNVELEKEGIRPIRTGIGIHTGTLLSGNIGSSERMEYTVMGDTVNTASRIEGITKLANVDILFSEEVAAATVPYKDKICNLGLFELKGKAAKVELYTIDVNPKSGDLFI